MILVIVTLVSIALIVFGIIALRERKVRKPKNGSTLLGSGIGLFVVMVIVALSVHFSMLTVAIHLEEVYDTALAYATEKPSDVLIIDAKLLNNGLNTQPFGRNTLVGGYSNTITDYNKNLYQLRGLSRDIWLSFLVVEPRNDLRPIIIK